MTSQTEVLTEIAAPASAGVAALALYQPTTLTADTWREWRPRVVDLAGQSHPGNASLARLSAGVLCEVLALTGLSADEPWWEVLSEANIRAVQADRLRRGKSIGHTARGVAELHRLQRLATDLPTPGAVGSGKSTFNRSQLTDLAAMTQYPDDALAHYARLILEHLREVQPHPWPSPLTSSEWTQFAKRARQAGFTAWRWRWRDLKAERIRRDFNSPEPVIVLLAALKPGSTRFGGLVSGTLCHAPRDVSAENASRLRGAHVESQSVSWRIGVKEAPVAIPAVKNPSSPTKISASAARRARAELVSQRSGDPDPLPEALERMLGAWSPRILTAEEWAQSRPLTTRILRRSAIRGRQKFEKALRVVAQYVTWSRQAGYDQDEVRLLSSRVIEEFIARGLPGAEESSRATARSILRSIATHAGLSPDAPVKAPPIAHWEISPPYQAHEITTFRRRIDLVTDVRIRRRVQTAFALGLGAGLEARDLRDLTRAHVDDLGDDGIRIDVPGERPRTAWLRQDCEDLLREGISTLTRNEHILGRPNAGKDILVDLYENARSLRGDRKIQQRRLRNTWIATLMCEPIPLWTVMRAAGLTSARSLSDLAQFLEPIGDTQITRGGTQ